MEEKQVSKAEQKKLAERLASLDRQFELVKELPIHNKRNKAVKRHLRSH